MTSEDIKASTQQQQQVAVLCDMLSLMTVEISMYLSMNDCRGKGKVVPGCLFAVVVI